MDQLFADRSQRPVAGAYNGSGRERENMSPVIAARFFIGMWGTSHRSGKQGVANHHNRFFQAFNKVAQPARRMPGCPQRPDG